MKKEKRKYVKSIKKIDLTDSEILFSEVELFLSEINNITFLKAEHLKKISELYLKIRKRNLSSSCSSCIAQAIIGLKKWLIYEKENRI